ncbi:histidine-rich glycoprotein-like [Venturia nashicola]|uniref:Histidine-rich glycoprotein-like n=1 Tax=Venturia nashicola TaxID=86259 RepID=A0A4Z1NGD3_9PEZI|nr:histidine-rich glycoprotein-like [Venturia nashicola]TLD20195.1 histidine-rich glycoprotein-like [Venturia nashicola]
MGSAPFETNELFKHNGHFENDPTGARNLPLYLDYNRRNPIITTYPDQHFVTNISSSQHLIASISSPASHRQHLITSISSPASHHQHLIASISSPASHHQHLITSISSPASHHQHFSHCQPCGANTFSPVLQRMPALYHQHFSILQHQSIQTVPAQHFSSGQRTKVMKTATVPICSFGLSRFAVLLFIFKFFIDALV